ncbi:hypothetical protein [Lysobacter sp. F6437]|uniref:hypothetical protein n=1 Tax=Lysobacter sp. F6437 TaxID=3459296 RepID=UPI00403D5F21
MHIFGTSSILALTIAVMAISRPAEAGIYSDDLSRCLVTHTSDEEKIVLAQWIFTVIAVHPSVASMTSISESTKSDVSKQTAEILQELLTESCKDETVQAVKYEGSSALESSFEVLGEIAMTALLADPKVAAESGSFIKYIDEAKIEAAFDAAQPGS